MPDDPTWIHAPDSVLCEGATILLTAWSGDAAAYEWYKDNQRIAGATAPSYVV